MLVSIVLCLGKAGIVPAQHDLSVRSEIARSTTPPGRYTKFTKVIEVAEAEPTLRQWLIQRGYHLGMAPMGVTTLLSLSLLNVLESEGLTQHLLESMGGTSNAGIVVSIWGTRLSKFANEYVKIWGKSLGTWHNHENCSSAEVYYLTYLNGPASSSEMDAMTPFVREANMLKAQMQLPFMKDAKPTQELTAKHRAMWLYWLRTMHVPKNFHDFNLPIVVVGYDREQSLGLILREGDVEAAVIGAASPHSVSKGIRNGEFLIGDGYPADNFGVKGYDGLFVPPSATAKMSASNRKAFPPRRIFNIVPMDSMEQLQCPMNWTSLLHHKHLKQVLTLMMSVQQSYLLMFSRLMHRQGLAYIQEKQIVHTAYLFMQGALDEKVILSGIKANDLVSFCSFQTFKISLRDGDAEVLDKLQGSYSEFRKTAYDMPVIGYKTVVAHRSREIQSLLKEKCMSDADQRSFFENVGSEKEYWKPLPCVVDF